MRMVVVVVSSKQVGKPHSKLWYNLRFCICSTGTGAVGLLELVENGSVFHSMGVA